LNRRALVVILVGLALLAIASTIRSGWLYLVASGLFAIVVYGFVSGYIETRGVRIEREVPAEVFERQPFKARLLARNNGRISRVLCTFTDTQFEPAAGAGSGLRRRRAEGKAYGRAGRGGEARSPGRRRGASVSFEKLRPGEEARAMYELSAPGRGLYEEAVIVLRCAGVFGVSGVRRTTTLSSPVLVYPEVSQLERFPFMPVATASPLETFEWERKGPGQDYFGVREYVRGDALRYIHWRSSAKVGELIVKEYQQEYTPATALLLLLRVPVFGDRHSNSLEDSIRAAASIVAFYSESGTVPKLFRPTAGNVEELEGGILESCLRSLALFEPDFTGGASEAAGVLSRAKSLLPGGAGLAVVTNLPLGDVKYLLGSPAAAGIAVVAAIDESYAARRAVAYRDAPVRELATSATARAIALYVITADRSVGGCLKEPLSLTDV
jgi:uncharacterized protein (DUF58 family)